LSRHSIIKTGESKRGGSPSFFFFPLSLIGEGDTGGEVEKGKRFFALLRMTRKVGDKGGIGSIKLEIASLSARNDKNGGGGQRGRV